MEVEVLEGNKPRKTEDKKEENIRKIKWAIDSADRLTSELYDLAASKELGEEDKSEYIDIIVATKGISKALGDILSRHSDLDAEIRNKIDEESDAFVEGLLGKKIKKAQVAKGEEGQEKEA